jgi:hypothetical protein
MPGRGVDWRHNGGPGTTKPVGGSGDPSRTTHSRIDRQGARARVFRVASAGTHLVQIIGQGNLGAATWWQATAPSWSTTDTRARDRDGEPSHV